MSTPTITPAATQNVALSISTNIAIVSATSNSSGTLSYYLDTSNGTTSSIATINTSIDPKMIAVGTGSTNTNTNTNKNNL